MSENITIARPYAKAIFDIAKKNNLLLEWDKLLIFLSNIIENEKVIFFVKNKTISHKKKAEFIINLVDFKNSFDKNMQKILINFINFLSFYNRILCIKNIHLLYKNYINKELNKIDVIIKTAFFIKTFQKDEIINSLSKKFNKKISALFEIDEKLLGGFVIKTGDFVLDASFIGNLNSLKTKMII